MLIAGGKAKQRNLYPALPISICIYAPAFPEMLLLSFLGQLYPKEIPVVSKAYSWFRDRLRIVLPDAVSGHVPFLLDSYPDFKNLVNATIPELKTGISSLDVQSDPVNEDMAKGNPELLAAIHAARRKAGVPQVVERDDCLDSNVIMDEEGQVWKKTIVSVHNDVNGKAYKDPISAESDGTKRLIEYMPLLFSILYQDGVFIVDEIERSIHPVLIKSILRKISESKMKGGQLIFTTHESCLLDLDVFRPDEIWFAQKDTAQSTKLYPLSDFKIHNTANIERGYLTGRYGGIPFLSNLKDLHW